MESLREMVKNGKRWVGRGLGGGKGVLMGWEGRGGVDTSSQASQRSSVRFLGVLQFSSSLSLGNPPSRILG